MKRPRWHALIPNHLPAGNLAQCVLMTARNAISGRIANMAARTPIGPNALVLRCDECEKRVTRDGYIKVDREAIAARFPTDTANAN